MFSLLLRIALVLFLLYLARIALRTILGNFLSQKSERNQGSREIRGLMMKDPVCGTYVDVQVALTIRKDGQNFYFCSEDCRRRFAG